MWLLYLLSRHEIKNLMNTNEYTNFVVIFPPARFVYYNYHVTRIARYTACRHRMRVNILVSLSLSRGVVFLDLESTAVETPNAG